MEKNISISITLGTIVKILLVVAGAALLWYLYDIVLIMLTSIVIASAVGPAARYLAKYKVPRTIGVIIVYLLFFGIFFGVMFFFVPPVLEDTASLISVLPQYLEKIGAANAVSGDALLQTQQIVSGLSIVETTSNIDSFLRALSGNFFALVTIVFGGLLSFILVIVFSFYFAMSEKGIEDFLRVITPVKNEEYVIGLWKRSQKKIGLWMQGQFLLALIIGLLVYLGLSIFGIPYALVLAVIAAMLELIPVFGPTLAAIPAVAIAFVNGGITVALLVVAFYVIIQQFENHLIYPLVVTKVVGVPPLLVILALLIGAKLGGILGIILSAPMAAVVQELFADLDKDKRRHFVESK